MVLMAKFADVRFIVLADPLIAAFRNIGKNQGESGHRHLGTTSGFNRNPARGLLCGVLDEETGSLVQGGPDQSRLSSSSDAGGQQSPPAPNISLNIHSGSRTGELYAAALCGIILQFGMLVFCGFSVYHPRFSQGFPKNDQKIRPYAFPAMATGTIILAIGMVICSFVVEDSTEEKVYFVPETTGTSTGNGEHPRPQRDLKVRILWLQKSHVVSDQKFDSHVIFGPNKSGPRGGTGILTSRRDAKTESDSTNRRTSLPRRQPWWKMKAIASTRREFLTILGVFFGLAGFVLQFQGLRGMNWSASIAQLVCILLMTIWRASVRRGLIAIPVAQQVLEDHEMDWLALKMANLDQQSGDGDFWSSVDQEPEGGGGGQFNLSEYLKWKVSTGDKNLAHTGFWDPGASTGEESQSQQEPLPGLLLQPQPEPELQPGLSNKQATYALNIRRRLGQLTNWTGQASLASISVGSSIEAVMNTLFKDKKGGFTWSLGVEVDDKAAKISLRIEKPSSEQGWKIDATTIEAALSLWVYHIRSTESSKKSTKKGAVNDWLRDDLELKREVVQLLGPDEPEKTLQRDIKWWVGDLIYMNNDTVAHRGQAIQVGRVGFVDIESRQPAPGNPYPVRVIIEV